MRVCKSPARWFPSAASQPYVWGDTTPFALLPCCYWCTEELSTHERGGRSWSVVHSWNFRPCLVMLFQKWEENFWQSNEVEVSVDELSVDQTLTRQSQTPGIDHLGRGGDDTLWNSAYRRGILAAFFMQGSHLTRTTFRGKKKHLSAFSFFQQHAKNSSAGTEQGKADYTFWLMVPCAFTEISFRSVICASVLEVGPEQNPGLKHLKLLGNSEDDLNFYLLVALYQFFL